MEYYKQQIKDTLEDIVSEGYETREEVLKRWEDGDTQDDFGNMTGSRFCSTYKAEEALKEAGFPWDSDLVDLVKEFDYDMSELLERGAEVVDVVLCELVLAGTSILAELKGEEQSMDYKARQEELMAKIKIACNHLDKAREERDYKKGNKIIKSY